MAGSAFRQGLYGDDADGLIDLLARGITVCVFRQLIRASANHAT